MSSTDDVSIRLLLELDLSSELDSEELGRVCSIEHGQSAGGSSISDRGYEAGMERRKSKLTGRRSSKSSSDVAHVGNDCLDSVSLSLDLGKEDGHPS